MGGDARYKKIIAKPQEIRALFVKEGVKAIPRKSREPEAEPEKNPRQPPVKNQIILDFDATDDPLHGDQEGAFFHGYYRHYCHLPLYCFCGNVPLLAELRDAKRDASSGTVEALEKITCAIRKRFGRKVRIIVRADSGFAREEIMAWCEENGIYYCLGLARNKRLSARLGKGFGELYEGIKTGEIQAPCRRFEDFEYRTRKSWSRARRVVGKAEILDKGENPRFVVTNLPAEGFAGEPEERFTAPALYEKLYCTRGEMENRIKEAQQDLFADRTNTGWMASNQLSALVLGFRPSHALGAAGRGVARHRSGRGHPRPDPAQTLQDRCPHQDQLSAHSSGVSQRLSLPGNFPACLCKPLRNAGGLNFKELLWTQENRAGFQPTQDPALKLSSSRQEKPQEPAL